MNTAIGFVIGGILCGGLGWLVASCMALENKYDAQKVYKAGYLEGYDDGIKSKECKYGTY